MNVLEKALSTKRPHGHTGAFCAWLRARLPAHTVDGIGNIHVELGNGSRTLFVAHVDTVHWSPGPNLIRKTETHWYADGGEPLGADDGAGVALLFHMIKSGVPGYYIFTQGEERGGVGSTWLAEHMPRLLCKFDRAVAFDRKATYSVITHQMYGRCCSDTFAEALCDRLNDQGLLYMPDDGGIYTDTAEFIDFIPECTNISVGYEDEHTPMESLNLVHFAALCRAVVAIDWEGLPTEGDDVCYEQPDLGAFEPAALKLMRTGGRA